MAITGPKERALLTALVMAAGDVVATDRLTDAVWGDHPPASSGKVLQNLVMRVRKVVGHEIVETTRGGYVLRAESGAVDVERFDRLTREGRSRAGGGEWAAAAAAFSAAQALWRGVPLSDVAEWAGATGEAIRLEEQHRTILEELAEAELACGRHRESVAGLEQMVSEEPLRERRWALLMLALARCGRQADALRAFQRARDALADLGLEPGHELRALEREIAADDAVLGAGEHGGRPATQLRMPAARHNLPASLTTFVGRTAELDEIKALLPCSRLLTLTGVGGAGKSRLAIETASWAVGRYLGGVWLVELAGMRDGASIPTTLAAAMGLEVQPRDDRSAVVDLLRNRLGGEPALVVFDNCEHLLEAVAELAHDLVTSCQPVTFLATSQELLGLPGERALAVPPMTLPEAGWAGAADVGASDAVALFCERATSARPQFQLTSANAPAVADICRHLDGIPLAIELAAARARALSVAEIARHLSDYFRLLAGGPRTSDSRHQTLRATLDWSYDLLSAPERAALRAVAIFPDRFDLLAAEAVLTSVTNDAHATAMSGFELMSRLVDRSLVVIHAAGEEIRYRLLEPVRRYAAQKMEHAGETDVASERHCAFFVARAISSRAGLGTMTHARRIIADVSNYRAALEWSWRTHDVDAALQLILVQMPMWLWEGDPQSIAWLQRVLPEATSADGNARADALRMTAVILCALGEGDPGRHEQLMEEAAAAAQRIGDAEQITTVNFSFGELELALGKTAEARRMIEAAMDGYERSGAPNGVGWCHHHLGWVSVADHDQHRALAHFTKAVEIAGADESNAILTVHALAGLAPVTLMLGDTESALCLAEQAIVDARQYGIRGVLTMALVRGAETATLAGVPGRGREILGELLEILHNSGARRWTAEALQVAALVLDLEGDSERAVEALGASEACRLRSGEAGGGAGAVADELERLRARLMSALGSARFASHHQRGLKLSAQTAMGEAITTLALE